MKITDMTAVELAAAMKAKEITVEEAVLAVFEQIEKTEEKGGFSSKLPKKPFFLGESSLDF